MRETTITEDPLDLGSDWAPLLAAGTDGVKRRYLGVEWVVRTLREPEYDGYRVTAFAWELGYVTIASRKMTPAQAGDGLAYGLKALLRSVRRMAWEADG